VHAVSIAASLIVEGESHPVAVEVAGRVVETRLELGRQVRAGEVLVELDSTVERLALEEARAKRAAIAPQIGALRAELAAETQALGELRGSRQAVMSEAEALLRQAEAAAEMADENATRNELARGSLVELEVLRARAEAEERRAAAEAQAQAASRKGWEQRQAESSRRAQLERLRRELSALQGELGSTAIAISRLEQDIERRQVRAPIAGRLGQIGSLRVGSVIPEGERVAMVVPAGDVKVIGEFAPRDALGRIRPGQHARLRLDGFPWSQYGSLEALVARVAGEVRDGSIRVELALRRRARRAGSP
jgi:membrane fusion protein (multidrug efflux system)